jgi:hypothetical protein
MMPDIFNEHQLSMIRYSSYGSTNYRTPSLLSDSDPLKAAYRELLELRERVRNAEAAAARRFKRRDAVRLDHKSSSQST